MDQKKRNVRQFLTNYPHSSRTLKDIDSVLSNFAALSPKQEPFVCEDGRSRVIVCLSGTLPINYRGQVYNIPIALWVPLQYPYQCPIPMVTPTANMVIKPSQHVDTVGRVYHPYLSSWSVNRDNQDMVGLLRIMQQVFSQEPPVYSKPQASTATSTPTSATSFHSMNQPPQPLDYPYYPQQNVYPQPASSSSSTNLYAAVRVNSSPSRFPSGASMPPLYQQSPRMESPPPPVLPARPPDPESVKLETARATLNDRLSKISVSQRLKMDDRIDKALEMNKELLKQESDLDQQLMKLRADQENLSRAVSNLKVKIPDAEKIEESLRNQKPIDPEEILVCPNVVYKQLLDTVAHDHAIEDALYALGKMFQRGKVDLAAYLRTVRSLSSEQFMKRALILKITSQIG